MQFAVIVLSLLATATAFAPSARSRATTSALKMADFSKEIGAMPPLGFWDPLGLMKDTDQETFDLYRKIETKHGRVAMLAVLGHITTTAGYRLPGEIAYGVPFSSIKNGLAAWEGVPVGGIVQMIIFVGLIEMGYETRQAEIEEVHLTKSKWNEKTIRTKKTVELNNGRAAMMGILGLMVHEKINNDPYIINSMLGSPVAFN